MRHHPKISIVIPYLSTSKSIKLCKRLIEKNTYSDYELIEIIDNHDVYGAFNDGMRRSTNNMVVFLCDDMFVSKNWDRLYCKYHNPHLILTGRLIEPGILGVSDKNIKFDCGVSPSTFKYKEFIKFIKEIEGKFSDIEHDKKGWYMPIMFDKSTYIEYPNEILFPYPNDVTLIDEILPARGFKFSIVKSFVYHLQNYSSRND